MKYNDCRTSRSNHDQSEEVLKSKVGPVLNVVTIWMSLVSLMLRPPCPGKRADRLVSSEAELAPERTWTMHRDVENLNVLPVFAEN